MNGVILKECNAKHSTINARIDAQGRDIKEIKRIVCKIKTGSAIVNEKIKHVFNTVTETKDVEKRFDNSVKILETALNEKYASKITEKIVFGAVKIILVTVLVAFLTVVIINSN